VTITASASAGLVGLFVVDAYGASRRTKPSCVSYARCGRSSIAIAEGYEVDEAEELALDAAEDAYAEYGGHDE